MTWTVWIIIGAFYGAIGVGAGAFGAHALKGRLTEHYLEVFETAVRYQMFHALALIALGLVATRVDSLGVTIAGWSFSLGVLIFSGSLYVLTLSGIRALGMITPLGGVALIVGWIALAVAMIKVS